MLAMGVGVESVGLDVLVLGDEDVEGEGSSAKLYPDTRKPVTVIPPSLSAVLRACRPASVPDKLLMTIAEPEGTIDTHLLSSLR